MGWYFNEETGEYEWEDDIEPDTEPGGATQSPGPAPYGYIWVQDGWEPGLDPNAPGGIGQVPRYRLVRDVSVPAASNRVPPVDRSAQNALDRAQLDFIREKDRLDREERKAELEYNRAIDEGRYRDAEQWKERLHTYAAEGRALEESYRRDQLRLTADLGYAGSRRADLDLNLRRQDQAFRQEMELRQHARDTARRGSSIYEYAFDTAGVPAPPGTRLAEIQARIKQTPSVEDFLGQQYSTAPPSPSGVQTAPGGGQSGPQPAWDEASILRELAARRARSGQV